MKTSIYEEFWFRLPSISEEVTDWSGIKNQFSQCRRQFNDELELLEEQTLKLHHEVNKTPNCRVTRIDLGYNHCEDVFSSHIKVERDETIEERESREVYDRKAEIDRVIRENEDALRQHAIDKINATRDAEILKVFNITD
jgi:hypothetical protein